MTQVLKLLKQRSGAWKNTPLYKQTSMAASAFFNKMHHYCTEGEKGRARELLRELFAELWPNEEWPQRQTWRAIGWKIGYELQIRDWFFKGKSGAGEFIDKYNRAMNYEPIENLMSADGWQLDGDGPTAAKKGPGEPRAGKKGDLKRQIDELIDMLASGEADLECGVNTKGHAVFSSAGTKKVVCKAKKNPTTYDITVEYDRTVLFNRIQRWARKEDIFGE